LERERRWSRTYRHPTKGQRFIMSRFLDGSASVTLKALEDGWAGWSRADRLDFCTNVKWLRKQADFSDILRFLAAATDPQAASSIALAVSTGLPQDEAFAILVRMLDATGESSSANFLQAIAQTRHPSAADEIRKRLAVIQVRPDIWADADFMNWTAFAAVCAVKELLQLGIAAGEFEQLVRALSEHPCAGVRDTCSRYVGSAYAWLPAPREPGPG
jgi:hypothetical protein